MTHGLSLVPRDDPGVSQGERPDTVESSALSPKAGCPLMSEEIAVLKTYGISGRVQPKCSQVLLSIFKA